MNHSHHRNADLSPAGLDSTMARSRNADARLDRILLAVWLGLSLLTLGCATLVSAAPLAATANGDHALAADATPRP